jgi:hypothetical protein
MHQMNLTRRAELRLILMVMAIAGCDSQDRRLAEYAQRATDQQARQNERMAQQAEAVARQGQEVAAAAHNLVEQDAAARRELIQAQDRLHQQNHVERSRLNHQREQVEAERKAASAAAVRDPVIAEAVVTAGLILATLLPLLVTIYAIRRLPERSPVDELLSDTLLQGLVTGQSAGHLPASPPQPLADSFPPRIDGRSATGSDAP